MQDLPADFRGLIEHWPSMRAFAREAGGEPEQGRIWARRNRVPKKHHRGVVAAAQARGLQGVTTEYLARLYAAGQGQGR